MSQNNNIGFNLIQIKTEEFALFEENYLDNEEINLDTNLILGINENEKIFNVTTKYIYQINKKPFMSLKMSCFFSIEKSSWNRFLSKEKNIIIFPKGFVAHMTMLTVGTSRGVLHSKTNGTPFNKYVLPTLNINAMVLEDVNFEIDKGK